MPQIKYLDEYTGTPRFRIAELTPNQEFTLEMKLLESGKEYADSKLIREIISAKSGNYKVKKESKVNTYGATTFGALRSVSLPKGVSV